MPAGPLRMQRQCGRNGRDTTYRDQNGPQGSAGHTGGLLFLLYSAVPVSPDSRKICLRAYKYGILFHIGKEFTKMNGQKIYNDNNRVFM